jgi:hypothetical protein
MYYLEKVINGILMFKISPDGPWEMVHPQVLTQRLMEAEKKNRKLKTKIKNAVDFLYDGTIDSADQALQILDKKHRKESNPGQ